jgi:Zn finger protein HypA/HybF involved in hydrogenase expression
MRNNLAKFTKLPLVFLSILLVFLSLTNVSGEATQPVYKVGDYFVYKLEETVTGAITGTIKVPTVTGAITGTITGTPTATSISCSFEANWRVEITKIDLPYVYAKRIYKNVKITGECQHGIVSPPKEGDIEELSYKINEKPSAEPKLFVDPSYSGTFHTSTTYPSGQYDTMSYKYNKGVLISATYEISMVFIAQAMFEGQIKETVKLNLIETSVPELISDNIMWWIIIGVIAAVAVAAVAVTLYIIKRRKTLAQPAQPSITYFTPNYCPNCGSSVNPEDIFCRRCGRKLK